MGQKGRPTPNLIGKRFGRLVVEEKSPEKGGMLHFGFVNVIVVIRQK